MWNRKVMGAVLACGLVGGTARTGVPDKRPERPAACTPTVTGAPTSVFDGSVSTFWRTPGLIQQQAVTIDLGCTARVFRFRRHMTCDGTATSGQVCGAVNADGKRHLGFDDVRFSPGACEPYKRAMEIGATGWDAYRLGAGFDGLPYGWTPWLDLKGVTARSLRFSFVDAGDALNEIQIEYAEGAGAVPGVSIVEVGRLAGFPTGIAAGPDRALWISEGLCCPNAGLIARLTTQGDRTEYPLPPGYQPRGITSGPDSALWFVMSNASDEGVIGRLTLDGDLTKYPVPSMGNTNSITTGPDGNLWFAGSSTLGSTTTAGAMTEFVVDGAVAVAAGPDNAVWFTIWGATSGAIGRITSSGQVTQFPIPVRRPLNLTFGSDGAIWFPSVPT